MAMELTKEKLENGKVEKWKSGKVATQPRESARQSRVSTRQLPHLTPRGSSNSNASIAAPAAARQVSPQHSTTFPLFHSAYGFLTFLLLYFSTFLCFMCFSTFLLFYFSICVVDFSTFPLFILSISFECFSAFPLFHFSI